MVACAADRQLSARAGISGLMRSRAPIGISVESALCILFVVLYSVWILPETAAWRNTCLVMGALVGLYVGIKNRHIFRLKESTPIYLIGLLFVWVIFHLIYLSVDAGLQLIELRSIWKRSALAALFALGLGLSLGKTRGERLWIWIYIGLCMPTIIFLMKYALTNWGINFGLKEIPNYLLAITTEERFGAKYYIGKHAYVAFCLPVLAVAMGSALGQMRNRHGSTAWIVLYFFTTLGVLWLFYAQNIKNGMLFSALLIIIAILIFFIKISKSIKKINIAMFISLLTFLSVLSAIHIQKNDAWKYFIADAKVSIKTDEFDNWKYAGEKGYPPNELKRLVTPTNYERIAWAIIGTKLIYENPFGYGLIENSFRPLVNRRWPESSTELSHSHSGWIDLALGVGIPGFCLVFSSLLIASRQSLRTQWPWAILGLWLLPALGLAWITTELSNSDSFECLIFFIVLVSAINSASHLQLKTAQHS